MKFPYSSVIAADPASGDYLLFRRPEIPVTIAGPSGKLTLIGLVDTGSDNTVFPRSVADYLGIGLAAGGPAATAFGGGRLELLAGEVVLAIESDDESIHWPATVSFHDFLSVEEETVILGHAGFLDYFTATFAGDLAALTLTPNEELPRAEHAVTGDDR